MLNRFKKHKEKEYESYSQCLNCGTDLQGPYCHKCGQHASSPNPGFWAFIGEYLNNAFIWDSKFFSTVWELIRRPGHLTNSFNSGRFVAYEHPLKLNMFFLFVFITIFLLFSDMDQVKGTANKFTTDENVLPILSLDMLSGDADYSKLMSESNRDTVTLYASLVLAEEYPDHVTCLEVKNNTEGKGNDLWIAILPSVLIEDKVILPDSVGVYHFNAESEVLKENIGLTYVDEIWQYLVDFLAKYFPMLFLLTAPFLSFAVRIVNYRNPRPFLHHFIFSLHYTAMMEMLMILIYLLYLIAEPPNILLLTLVVAGSLVYLALAVRNVYSNTWAKSIFKSFVINLTYAMILFFVLVIIFVISVSVVAWQYTMV